MSGPIAFHAARFAFGWTKEEMLECLKILERQFVNLLWCWIQT